MGKYRGYIYTIRSFTLCLVFFLLSSISWAADISSLAKKEIKQGNLAYNKGEFSQAVENYKNAFRDFPESDIVNFNLGTALYKNKDYKMAMGHFERGLVSSNPSLEQKSSFNLANAKYKYALTQEESNLTEAVNLVKQSLHHYNRSLELDPRDEDAKHNQDYVTGELKRLETKLAKQPQCKNEGDNQDKENQDKQEKEQSAFKQEKKEQSAQQKQQDQEKMDKNKKQQQQAQATEKQDDKKNKSEEKQVSQSTEKSDDEKEKDKTDKLAQQQKESEDKENKNQSESKEKPMAGLSKEQALMLLRSYSSEEEPKGLYKPNMEVSNLENVTKDW